MKRFELILTVLVCVGGIAFADIATQKLSNGQILVGPTVQCQDIPRIYNQAVSRIAQQQNMYAQQDEQMEKQRNQEMTYMNAQRDAYKNAAQQYCNQSL